MPKERNGFRSVWLLFCESFTENLPVIERSRLSEMKFDILYKPLNGDGFL